MLNQTPLQSKTHRERVNSRREDLGAKEKPAPNLTGSSATLVDLYCGFAQTQDVPIQCMANYYYVVLPGKVTQVTSWQTGWLLPRM